MQPKKGGCCRSDAIWSCTTLQCNKRPMRSLSQGPMRSLSDVLHCSAMSRDSWPWNAMPKALPTCRCYRPPNWCITYKQHTDLLKPRTILVHADQMSTVLTNIGPNRSILVHAVHADLISTGMDWYGLICIKFNWHIAKWCYWVAAAWEKVIFGNFKGD